MVAFTLVANAARAVPTRQSAKSAAKAQAVGATPAFVARHRGDAGVAVSARSRKASAGAEASTKKPVADDLPIKCALRGLARATQIC